MKTYYYRTYDKTLWRLERCHEVEVVIGVYAGAVTLQRVGKPSVRWTCIDTVFFQKLNNGMLRRYVVVV